MGIVAQSFHAPAFPTRLRSPDLPLPSEDARRHSDELSESIRKEIGSASGWIDFARFMGLALYAPGRGYYVAGAAKLGGEGDFVTSPEISPLFGRTLARQIAGLLARTGGDILELGAGSGALAAEVLRELSNLERLPRRYLILDVSPQLVQRQQRTIEQHLSELTTRVEWIATLPEDFTGVVIANEVLDALPVHLIAWHREGLFERGVGWKDGFVWLERPLPPGPLLDAAEAAGVQAEYASEISLLAPALVRTLSEVLRCGAASTTTRSAPRGR